MNYALTPEGYDAFWGWFLIGSFCLVATLVTVFALYEGPGLKPGGQPNTLSAWVRRHLGIAPKAPRRVWAVPLFLGVCYGIVVLIGWFVWHITVGGPTAAVWHASGMGDMLWPTNW
jgi:hypothetical protein